MTSEVCLFRVNQHLFKKKKRPKMCAKENIHHFTLGKEIEEMNPNMLWYMTCNCLWKGLKYPFFL